jgi:hypothetical protein
MGAIRPAPTLTNERLRHARMVDGYNFPAGSMKVFRAMEPVIGSNLMYGMAEGIHPQMAARASRRHRLPAVVQRAHHEGNRTRSYRTNVCGESKLLHPYRSNKRASVP